MYAHELGLADEMDDTKVTYALEMVRGLFSAWATAHGVQPYELPSAAKPPDRCVGRVRQLTNHASCSL